MILIGLCIKEADRLGVPADDFFKRNIGGVFAVAGAYQEFESLMHGYEGGKAGVYETLLSDLVRIADILDRKGRIDIEEAVSEARIKGEERKKVARWLATIGAGAERGPAIRKALRSWEETVAGRKAKMRREIPCYEPTDTAEVERVREELVQRWDGGMSWKQDALIFAQTHERACSTEVAFVSNDRHHFGRRREELLSLTRVREIEDLAGHPLGPCTPLKSTMTNNPDIA